MTKILYLPTGRYLKFILHNSNKARTEIIEESDLYYTNYRNFDKFITDLISTDINSWNDKFMNANNLIDKINLSDIEIIND